MARKNKGGERGRNGVVQGPQYERAYYAYLLDQLRAAWAAKNGKAVKRNGA